MTKHQYVNLTCPHCGHQWLEPTTNLLAAEVVVYRDDQTRKRRLRCSNCDRGVTVEVPKEWLDHE